MLKFLLASAAALALSACVNSSVTPISANQIIINTSAAPICSGAGAQSVAVKMAAVETLRRGYERFVIVGMDSANNVGVMRSAPTYANSTYRAYGNTLYGNTTYGGGNTIVYGSHDAALGVVLLKQGDRGFSEGVDAKSTLGEKWEDLVKNGVKTCG